MSRRAWPGLVDFTFGLVLASVLLGGRFRLVNDPGSLWHLRLGRDILATGTVPRVDTLTFTRQGEPWVDQSWLFDVILALVVDHGGLASAAAVSALGIATVYALLVRWLVQAGRPPLVAFFVGLIAAGVGAIHFLIRPHLFTLAFVALTLHLCRQQHDRGGRFVWLTPPLVALWANLHGGFLAGPLIVVTAGLAHACAGPWDAARRRTVATFIGAGGACILAALVNPYGWGLYQHVGRLLVSSGVTSLIEEYQPMPFGRPDARAYELILVALIGVPSCTSGRMSRYNLVHALVWLHLSLASVRHAPLFALAVAPGLAEVMSGWSAIETKQSDRAGLVAWSIWPGFAAVALLMAAGLGVPLTRLDPTHWPLAGMSSLDAAPAEDRLFHEQDWGGLIAAESRPRRKTYLDDRFELYGKAGILRYLNALEGGPDWDVIRDVDQIGLVFVRPDRPLVRRLRQAPGWRLQYEDEVSVLFERVRPSPDPARLVSGEN